MGFTSAPNYMQNKQQFGPQTPQPWTIGNPAPQTPAPQPKPGGTPMWQGAMDRFTEFTKPKVGPNPFLTPEAQQHLQNTILARTNQTNQQFAGLGNQANIGLAGRGMLGSGQQQAVQGGLAAQKATTLGNIDNALQDRNQQLATAWAQNEQSRIDGNGQADLLYGLRKAELDNALEGQEYSQIAGTAAVLPQLLMALFGSPTGGKAPDPLFKTSGLGLGGNA